MLLGERNQELQSLNGFLPVVALNKTHSFTEALLGSVWKLAQLETIFQLCNAGHSDGSQRLFLVVEGNNFGPGAEVAGVLVWFLGLAWCSTFSLLLIRKRNRRNPSTVMCLYNVTQLTNT